VIQKSMKVIILARVSSEEQDSNAQLIRLKKYCESKSNFESPEIFDFDESGYKDNRVKFAGVLDRLKKSNGRIALCCDKIDRLTRNFNEELVQLERLRASGRLEMHFPSDGIVIDENSPASDLFRFGIGVIAAKYYSDSISDNVKRKFEEKISKGEILTKAVYGYRNIRIDDKHGSVKIEPYEAEIVKKVFEWYDSKSYSLNEIRLKLKKDYSLDYHRSKVERILKEKFYYGIASYRKGKLEYAHSYPTIISKDIFDRCQDILQGRAKSKGKMKFIGKPALYRGLLRCANCGRAISPEQHRGKFYYSCTDYDKVCKKKYISEDKITIQLAQAFKSIQVPKEGLDFVVENLRKVHSDKKFINEKTIDNLNNEFKNLDGRKSKMYDDYLDKSITRDFYESKWKEYNSRQDEITDQLSKLTKSDESYYITMGYVFQLAQSALDLFVGSEMEERRQIINLVFQNASMNGDKLVYTMAEPFNLLQNLDESTIWGSLLDIFRTNYLTLSFNISIEQFKSFFQNFELQPIIF